LEEGRWFSRSAARPWWRAQRRGFSPPSPSRRCGPSSGKRPRRTSFQRGPCLFEEDEADLLVGLFDRCLLALKCVVSDSKEAGAARLQEAVQAAKRWGAL